MMKQLEDSEAFGLHFPSTTYKGTLVVELRKHDPLKNSS